MNLNKRIITIIAGLIMLSSVLVCCGNKINEEHKIEGLKINKGSIINNNNGIYSNLNLEGGKYKKINNIDEELVGVYDYKSGNYLIESKGKYIAFHNNKRINIDNIQGGDKNFKLAPMGNYLLFLRDNETKIVKIETGEFIDFKPKVLISGSYIDWIDEDTLVYYGVRLEDKINGIFTYDINTGEENVLIEFSDGNVGFLKAVNDGVVYVQDKIDGNKVLKYISPSDKIDTILSEDVQKVYDVIKLKESYYILGSFKGMNSSLYKLESDKAKRLVYGFPGSISETKGLAQNEEGDILFIGSNVSENVEEVYKCTSEGAISEVYNTSSQASFIRGYVKAN